MGGLTLCCWMRVGLGWGTGTRSRPLRLHPNPLQSSGCRLCPLGFKSAMGSWLPPGTRGQGLWGKGLCYDEKEMATHSSILAWRIPWTEAPGRLQLMQVHRFRLG